MSDGTEGKYFMSTSTIYTALKTKSPEKLYEITKGTTPTSLVSVLEELMSTKYESLLKNESLRKNYVSLVSLAYMKNQEGSSRLDLKPLFSESFRNGLESLYDQDES